MSRDKCQLTQYETDGSQIQPTDHSPSRSHSLHANPVTTGYTFTWPKNRSLTVIFSTILISASPTHCSISIGDESKGDARVDEDGSTAPSQEEADAFHVSEDFSRLLDIISTEGSFSFGNGAYIEVAGNDELRQISAFIDHRLVYTSHQWPGGSLSMLDIDSDGASEKVVTSTWGEGVPTVTKTEIYSNDKGTLESEYETSTSPGG